jgi:anti-sigma factor RsiW
LTLREISQASDEQIVQHTRECPRCATRLQARHMLAGAMQSLSAATAHRQAGARVEQALLSAFRRQGPSPAPSRRVLSVTPSALRLSRWFEVGAYAAVAAACLIAIFLGYRVWSHPAEMPIRVQNVPSVTAPASLANPQGQVTPKVEATVETPSRGENRTPGKVLPASGNTALTDEALAKAGYTDLMFCDPLSCASDAEVVRMELPAQGSTEQTVADVVVGDDGLVRAIRIVN